MNKIILSFIASSTILFAQTIDFDKALEETLKNNKQIKNNQLDINISNENSKEILGVQLGKVEFSHEASKTNHAGYVFNSKLSSREVDSSSDFFDNPLNNPDDRNNFISKISYTLPIFTGFKVSNQKDILKLQTKANELKLNLNKKQIAYEVLKAYNAAVVAKEFISAVNKTKEAITFVVKQANEFHKEGLVTKIDVKQAKVHELNVNSRLIEAQNSFDIAISYLKFLTTDDAITDVKSMKHINLNISSIENLYNEAIKNRDEFKMQEINTLAMKKNINMVNSEYYPKIYTHIEYGFNDNRIDLDNTKDYYMAVLGVKYNLFDLTRSTKKQKATLHYKKSTNNLEQLEDNIKLEIKKSVSNLKSKEKVLSEKIKAKELAQEVFEQSNLMYKNQLISMTNLLEQEANLQRNEAALITAKYDYSMALANIALVLGIDFTQHKGNK